MQGRKRLQRTMSFKEVFGHESRTSLLGRAIRAGRIAHAYLFHGMEGIGKRTAALAFAKAINCLREDAAPCGECASCGKAGRGVHPDIIAVSAGQAVRIGDIRDLQAQMIFRPFEGKRRIFILDEADRMNIAAANALLKTLEEPFPSNILILVTSRPDHLPATILSRCQRLGFDPLPAESVAAFLTERHSVGKDQARILASSSGGSIGRALLMKDQGYIELRDRILDGIAAIRGPADLFPFLAEFGSDKEPIMTRLDILSTVFRDALVYRETGSDEDLIHPDRAGLIRALADAAPARNLLDNIRAVGEARQALERNVNKQLTLELMMFRLFPAFMEEVRRSGAD